MLEVFSLSDAVDFLLSKKVVIFDLDDTLYSEKEYVRSGFREIAMQNKGIRNMAEKLWAAFEAGEKAIDHVLKSEGVYSEEKAAECLSVYRSHLPKINLYPEAEHLLKELTARGIPLGMITDGRPEGQRAKILSLGLERYFRKIIVTDELGGTAFRKPNPRSYEIMRSFFDVPYEEMVYVGDNSGKDFIAPKELGMSCVWFRNRDGLYAQP